MSADELLTEDEHALIGQLGECATDFSKLLGDSVTSDLAEFVDKIHQLQCIVLSQAAARAYPNTYRLLGRVHPDA